MEHISQNPEVAIDPLAGLACSIDVETTGIDLKLDRVISFGYVEMVNGSIGKSIEWFFNPGTTPIHPDAEKVHGISAAFLADKPPIKAYLPKIIELVVEMIVCGHNVKFDIDMLNAELVRHRFPPLDQYIAGIYDTMKESRKRWPGKPASLDALCSRLEVSTQHREKHGALVDAMLCAEALIAMRRGQQSLLDQTESASSLIAPGAEVIPLAPVIVLAASPQEVQEHERYLAELQAKGTEPVWYQEPDDEFSEVQRPS